MATGIKYSPFLLDPVSKIAFRIRDGVENEKYRIYGKTKGGEEHWVPDDDHSFERAEMLNAFISEEEYENY